MVIIMASNISIINHLDSERGNLLPLCHGLLFQISSKESFVTPVVEHSVVQKIAQWIYQEGWI